MSVETEVFRLFDSKPIRARAPRRTTRVLSKIFSNVLKSIVFKTFITVTRRRRMGCVEKLNTLCNNSRRFPYLFLPKKKPDADTSTSLENG